MLPGYSVVIFIIIFFFALYTVIELYEHKCIRRTGYSVNLGLDKRILVISDLHNYSISSKTCERMAAEQPNYIFIAGDLINHDSKNLNTAVQNVKRLSRIADIYYSLGNHEVKFREKHPDIWKVFIKSLPSNCIILDNAHMSLDESTELYGITLPRRFFRKGRRYDYSNETPEIKEEAPGDRKKIVLAHMPGFLPYYDLIINSDLVISGHLHGGMIRLPLIGGLVYFTKGDKKYDCGLFDNRMVVSRGLGNHFLPLRFNNRCEFIILDL